MEQRLQGATTDRKLTRLDNYSGRVRSDTWAGRTIVLPDYHGENKQQDQLATAWSRRLRKRTNYYSVVDTDIDLGTSILQFSMLTLSLLKSRSGYILRTVHCNPFPFPPALHKRKPSNAAGNTPPVCCLCSLADAGSISTPMTMTMRRWYISKAPYQDKPLPSHAQRMQRCIKISISDSSDSCLIT